jgi:predicted nucleic acid-binding protein
MRLNLSQIPAGTKVFIDSNIFLYVFFSHPVLGKSCYYFLKRIESGDISGFVDEFVLNEVYHKLMITGIVNRYHCEPHEVISLIKRSPSILAELSPVWEASDLLQKLNLTCIPGPFFPDAFQISREWNLLSTDAVHVAAMRKEQISFIATNDTDFTRVSSFQVYRPASQDLPG